MKTVYLTIALTGFVLLQSASAFAVAVELEKENYPTTKPEYWSAPKYYSAPVLEKSGRVDYSYKYEVKDDDVKESRTVIVDRKVDTRFIDWNMKDCRLKFEHFSELEEISPYGWGYFKTGPTRDNERLERFLTEVSTKEEPAYRHCLSMLRRRTKNDFLEASIDKLTKKMAARHIENDGYTVKQVETVIYKRSGTAY